MTNFKLEIQTSHSELIDLCRSYWDFSETEAGLIWRFKVSDLAEKYGLRVSDVFVTVKQYSQAFFLPIECAQCRQPYILGSRADYQQCRSRSVMSWRCLACTDRAAQEAAEHHRKAAQEAAEHHHKAAQAAAEQKRKDEQDKQCIVTKFLVTLQTNSDPPDIHSMSLTDAVYLSSMLRLGANEEIAYINSINSFAEPLSPSAPKDIEIAKHLHKRQILAPHPCSPIAAFSCENGELKSFDVLKVAWGLSGSGKRGITLKLVFSNLESHFRSQNMPEHWYAQIPLLQKEILLLETLQYFQIAMEEHHFSFTPGEKTFQVLSETLEMFSLGQAFNIIWRATRDAAAYFVRESIPRLQAANSVVGTIQRYAQRAHANKWELASYRRDRRCPQSMVSQVFFNSVLQIGDAYLDLRNDAQEASPTALSLPHKLEGG